jgi:hypothetical protein
MVCVEVGMSKVVTLPYDPVWTALTWAKKNCSSYITNDVHKNTNESGRGVQIDYFFGEGKDAVLFSLKWL